MRDDSLGSSIAGYEKINNVALNNQNKKHDDKVDVATLPTSTSQKEYGHSQLYS